MSEPRMVDTHPELPQLPEGQFWRISTRSCSLALRYVTVDLRRRTERKWFFPTVRLEKDEWIYMPTEGDVREDAVRLAERIIEKRAKRRVNVLGDLEGDHPS